MIFIFSTCNYYRYQISYKEPFYKLAQVKERIPGWCDRILWLQNDSQSELVACTSQKYLNTKLKQKGVHKNKRKIINEYCSVNDGGVMSASDHSAVYAAFRFSSNRSNSLMANELSSMSQTYITLTVGKLSVDYPHGCDYHFLGKPTDAQIIFPAPFEDLTPNGNGMSRALTNESNNHHHFSSAARTASQLSEHRHINGDNFADEACCKLNWITSRPAHQLHLIVRLYFAGTESTDKRWYAQTSVSLNEIKNMQLTEIQAPLLKDGLPIIANHIDTSKFSPQQHVSNETETNCLKERFKMPNSSISGTKTPVLNLCINLSSISRAKRSF